MLTALIGPNQLFLQSLKDFLEPRQDCVIFPVIHETEALLVFAQVADDLERLARDRCGGLHQMKSVVCVLDAVSTPDFLSSGRFNPTRETRSFQDAWPAAAAMLVLAFPEVYFVFLGGGTSGQSLHRGDSTMAGRYHTCSTTEVALLHDLIRVVEEGYVPLFDGTGLREHPVQLLRCGLGNETKKKPFPIAARGRLGTAVDEEPAYAQMLSYAAYRDGFRMVPLCSLDSMERFVGPGRMDDPGPPILPRGIDDGALNVAIEDVYLTLPDEKPVVRPDHTTETRALRLSDFSKRYELYPHFEKATHHVLVTVGHERGADSLDEIVDFIEGLSHEHSCRIAYKPVAGVYDLRRELALPLGGDYRWPPEITDFQMLEQLGHSAPGRLLAIANRLLQRAASLDDGGCSIETAITGAVLALNAQQLLANMTPITALNALKLRHEFEVMAECHFTGVGYNFDTRARLEDIAAECDNIGAWFNEETSVASVLSAQATIVNAVGRRFEQLNQFDEREDCLRRARTLNRMLSKETNPLANWFNPIWAYLEKLINSVAWFAGSLVFWPVLFTLLYWVLRFEAPALGEPSLWSAFVFSVTTFFGLGPILSGTTVFAFSTVSFLVLSEVILGFLHLGVFVSHLYSLLSRR